jgi:hypothetical protein
MDLIDWTAEVAANWWTDLLQQGDKATFNKHLRDSITNRLRERGLCIVECDYDPKDILLEAVRAAGIECRGMASSADGILPYKVDTLIRPGSIQPTSARFPHVDTGNLVIATDVGYDDHTVTVVAKYDRNGEFIVKQIIRDEEL